MSSFSGRWLTGMKGGRRVESSRQRGPGGSGRSLRIALYVGLVSANRREAVAPGKALYRHQGAMAVIPDTGAVITVWPGLL